MAVSFLNDREVSDLCLGKPPLRWVAVGATVGDTLLALKRSGETQVSVWSCSADHSSNKKGLDGSIDESLRCRCVGKICMVDIICFLCRDENLANPFEALEAPVSQILIEGPPSTVRHLEPNSSLLLAIDYILEGTQNLVVPIENNVTKNSRKKFLNKPASISCTAHNGRDYCWITQEDVLRFLLNSIGVFNPIPTYTIESLNMIDHDIMTIHYSEPASSALACISRSLEEQTSVAVIDENSRLIGEISPFTLAFCDETVAAAIATLSAGDLMAYIDCGGPPEDLLQLVKMRLEEKHLDSMLDLLDENSSSSLLSQSPSSPSSSSEDESAPSKYGATGRYSPGRRSEAILCYPWSSLVAVLIQALAHRVSCVWVVEGDHTLVGHVTFEGMLKVFRSISGTKHKQSI